MRYIFLVTVFVGGFAMGSSQLFNQRISELMDELEPEFHESLMQDAQLEGLLLNWEQYKESFSKQLSPESVIKFDHAAHAEADRMAADLGHREIGLIMFCQGDVDFSSFGAYEQADDLMRYPVDEAHLRRLRFLDSLPDDERQKLRANLMVNLPGRYSLLGIVIPKSISTVAMREFPEVREMQLRKLCNKFGQLTPARYEYQRSVTSDGPINEVNEGFVRVVASIPSPDAASPASGASGAAAGTPDN